MSNKTRRKLSLKKEDLRRLDPVELGEVAGGTLNVPTLSIVLRITLEGASAATRGCTGI